MTSRTAQVNLNDFGLWDEIVLGQDVLCPLRISRKHVNNTSSRDTTSQGRRHLRAIRLSYKNNKKQPISAYQGFKKTEGRTLLNMISGVSASRSFARAGQSGFGAGSPSA
jgi:hypothetical protein